MVRTSGKLIMFFSVLLIVVVLIASNPLDYYLRAVPLLLAVVGLVAGFTMQLNQGLRDAIVEMLFVWRKKPIQAVTVRALELKWPLLCVCCGSLADTNRTIKYVLPGTSTTIMTRTWNIPYCKMCSRHVDLAEKLLPLLIALSLICGIAAIVSFGSDLSTVCVVFLVLLAVPWLIMLHLFESSASCPTKQEAVAFKDASPQTNFSFRNTDYAWAFIEANRQNVISPSTTKTRSAAADKRSTP